MGPDVKGSECKPLVRTEVRVMGMKRKGREQNQVRAGEEVGEAEHRPQISLKLGGGGHRVQGAWESQLKGQQSQGLVPTVGGGGVPGPECNSDPIWSVTVPECAHAPSQGRDCPLPTSVPRPAPEDWISI